MIDILCCIAAIGLHLGSTHLGNDTGQSLNNINPGGYVQLNSGFTFGGYHNSIRQNSYYAGYTYRFPSAGPFTFSLMAGGISGYGKDIYPAVVPSLSLKVASHTELRLTYIPKIPITQVHTLHISVERRF